MAKTKFSIGSINVTYPQVNPPFNPVVFTTDSTNRITRGWWGGSSLPDGALKIPDSSAPDPSTNVQPTVVTQDGQYLISYAPGATPPAGTAQTYVVSMQNVASASLNNQTALWSGTDVNIEFVLNIDVSVSPNVVTLTEATDS